MIGRSNAFGIMSAALRRQISTWGLRKGIFSICSGWFVQNANWKIASFYREQWDQICRIFQRLWQFLYERFSVCKYFKPSWANFYVIVVNGHILKTNLAVWRRFPKQILEYQSYVEIKHWLVKRNRMTWNSQSGCFISA